jgi:hypothetical protein
MALPVATLAILSFSAPAIRHNSCCASLIAALALHCCGNMKQQAISIMTGLACTADKYGMQPPHAKQVFILYMLFAGVFQHT